MIGDFFTKPLQGVQFKKFSNLILNIADPSTGASDGLEECVGNNVDVETSQAVNQITTDNGWTAVRKNTHNRRNKRDVSWADVVKRQRV